MSRLAVFGAALVALSVPAAAQGFNPFGDTAVNRYTWGRSQAPAAQASPKGRAAQPAPARPQQPGFLSFGDDDDDAPPAPQRNQASLPPMPGGTLDGGPRPSISASTPPRVAFRSTYGAGNIVIDSGGRALYYVLNNNEALRYPIAVGREGFSWTGVERVSRKAEWPDWRPPAEMRERQPNLPEVMSGGIRNPLGARAIYLGATLYRIHGTNDARSIGSASSSGCFRMTNANIVDLYGRVSSGTKVHVVPRLPASVGRGVADNDTVPVKRRAAAL